MMKTTSQDDYPVRNIFFSKEWTTRAAELGLDPSRYVVQSIKGLKVASLACGMRNDIEPWPTPASLPPQGSCDLVIHRKLLGENRPSEATEGWVLPYCGAPWLDLGRPVTAKSQVAAHIRRTERKITREIGALSLFTATDATKKDWFDEWSAFQASTGRFDDAQIESLRTWLLSGDLPDWVRLVSLQCTSNDGVHTLASGIFYVWEGVFYYFAPVRNPSEKWRRYGPGKLLVQKLIDSAIAEGCQVFDFLQGQHEYKMHWNPEVRTLYQCIVPCSLKGRVALALLRVRNKIRHYFRRQCEPEIG